LWQMPEAINSIHGKCNRLQPTLLLLLCNSWHYFEDYSNPPFRCLSTSLDPSTQPLTLSIIYHGPYQKANFI
jgi:hypothetical protein